jgi:uncharacterized membrane protein
MRIDGRHYLGILVAFLAFTGVGASVFYFLREASNPRFVDFPIVTLLHVVLGGIYLVMAPFQFLSRIRSRWLSYHRLAGRFLVSIGLVLGASALFLALIIPFSGTWEQIINGFFGTLFLVSLVKGVLHVRAGQIALHREWMLRAFAIGLGIATMRLIFIPALIIVGDPTQEQIATLSIVSFTVAFSLHSGFAEYWIRRSRNLAGPAKLMAKTSINY